MNVPPGHSSHPSRTAHPTPRTATTSRVRSASTSTSTTRLHHAPIPPQAPRPSRDRRPDPSISGVTNPLFNLPQQQTLVPRASCGKADDLLAPPDAQSCPFAKAGLKVLGMGGGAYGELEGWLEWPAELYAVERKDAHIAREIKALYSQDEVLRTPETTDRVIENLCVRVAKMADDEWMYASTDTLYKREKD